MSEPTRRDRAVEELLRALRRARLSLEPVPGDVGLMVDLLIDAAAEGRRDKRRARLAEGRAEYDRRLAESPDAEVIRRAFPQAEEDVGRCTHCGKPSVIVRPGDVARQPTCECWRRYV